jgi:pimeloyl-ACP methyl ester carboxylesterase
MPGFGLSEEPKEPWGIEEYVTFVIHFLEAIQCKKVSIIGHSNGGRVIIRMANRKELPFAINKLVLVNSAGIVPIKTTQQKIKLKTFKIMKKIVSLKLVSVFFPDALNNLKNKHGSADYKNASIMMKQCMVKAVNDDLTSLMPTIPYETLLIWRENDTATPLKDGKKMEELIPKAGLVTLEKAGHYSFLDQPYIFKKVIQSFFGI